MNDGATHGCASAAIDSSNTSAAPKVRRQSSEKVEEGGGGGSAVCAECPSSTSLKTLRSSSSGPSKCVQLTTAIRGHALVACSWLKHCSIFLPGTILPILQHPLAGLSFSPRAAPAPDLIRCAVHAKPRSSELIFSKIAVGTPYLYDPFGVDDDGEGAGAGAAKLTCFLGARFCDGGGWCRGGVELDG